ncbi:MAG TPA: hypothetical protein VMV71_01030 [Candidatus Paceibacterota bacterium]|nr:hypothetical protein [Candidatus Paceibacterota bacterium]
MSLNPSVERFHEKLIKLAGAGSRIGLAAASAMANSCGMSEITRSVISDQLDGTIKKMDHLANALERIGQKSRQA